MAAEERTNILLVDDREENLAALEAVLEDLGQILVKARSAQEALRSVLTDDFAVVLLDVQMPDIDGFEAARLIRQREKSQHIPIIFITAVHGGELDVCEGYASGALDYVVKPFNPRILKAKVAAFVELARSRRRLQQEIEQRKRAEEEVRLLNAELEQRVAERTARIESLAESRRIEERQAAVLQERNRMAQEIHDTLAQGFTGIAIQLEAATAKLPDCAKPVRPHIERARQLALESLAEARRSIWALRPQALDGESLPSALATYVRKATAGTSTAGCFRVCGEPAALAPEAETQLLRIGQEAVANARRHARASHITVELAYERGQVELSIFDDGHGFDLNSPRERKGLGLVGIKERAEKIGARLEVESRPGTGTSVRVSVPCPPAAMREVTH